MSQLYVSADNHLNTQWIPARMWQERLPARHRERGPHVEETGRGSYWVWEGRLRKRSADGSSNRSLQRETFGDLELPDGALPPSDPALVRRHLDMANVHAAVFYGDGRKWGVEDPELRRAMYRAYNEFALELSACEPNRLIYLPQLPSTTVAECLQELRWVGNRGARAVELSVSDLGEPLHDHAWEPLWAEAEERGIVVCSHKGHGAGTEPPSHGGGLKLAHHATSPFVAAKPITQLVFSGVFERHPRLMWVVAESRIGWLPFLFSWMDRQLEIRGADPTVPLALRPTEYVLRNLRFTFEHDLVGARLLEQEWTMLQDVAMWGCDYPHHQEIWPETDTAAEQFFSRLDPAVRHQLVFGRAAELFEIDLPPQTVV